MGFPLTVWFVKLSALLASLDMPYHMAPAKVTGIATFKTITSFAATLAFQTRFKNNCRNLVQLLGKRLRINTICGEVGSSCYYMLMALDWISA